MLGARIAALRLQAGLSQAELAKRLSVSPSAVGMYEQGRREPSMDRIVALSEIFGVTTDYLLTGLLLTPGDRRAMEQVLSAMVAQGNALGLSEECVSAIMNAIHEESVRVQNEVLK